MNILLNFLGYILDKLYSLLIRYKSIQVNQLLGGARDMSLILILFVGYLIL